MIAIDPGSARVIEIGEATAGIVAAEHSRRLRFYSAQAPVDRLDGRLFASLDRATRAIQGLLDRRPRARDAAEATARDVPDRRDRTGEYVLAVYGPFPHF